MPFVDLHAVQLDEHIDALAGGQQRAAVADPSAVGKATRRLVGRWRQRPSPKPTSKPLRQDPIAQERAAPGQRWTAEASSGDAARRRGGQVPRRRQARPARPLAGRSTAAVLVLALLGSFLAFRPAASSPTGQGAPSVDLYVSYPSGDDAAPRRLIPLDPMTLADRTDGVRVELGQDANRYLAISADGSTLVGIRHSYGDVDWVDDSNDVPDNAVTITVRDGRTGAERVRFHPSAHVIRPLLNQEGTRLVVEAIATGFDPRATPPGWHVYDTRDGRLLTTIENRREVWGSWIDPSGRRLYHLRQHVAAGSGEEAEIIAYDLGAGREIARLVLPDVLIGFRATDRGFAEVSPGGALSPDGRMLAIAHADREALTLIDVERLAIVRTVSLRRPTGLRERLSALLALAPQGAAAKGPWAGTIRRAVYAPDGRHLYVHGLESTVADDGAPSERGLGLMRVDLDDGEIVAEALPDEQFHVVLPTPDGRTVYVFGPEEPGGMFNYQQEATMRRLDPLTLAVIAEREFDGWRDVVMKPTVPTT